MAEHPTQKDKKINQSNIYDLTQGQNNFSLKNKGIKELCICIVKPIQKSQLRLLKNKEKLPSTHKV